jgi:hypothetical protein
MNHRERAQEIVDRYNAGFLDPEYMHPRPGLVSFITSALAAVEREALERAAVLCDFFSSDVGEANMDRATADVCRECYEYAARKIRALIEQPEEVVATEPCAAPTLAPQDPGGPRSPAAPTSPRCDVCGYNLKDAVLHGDHHLCSNKRPPWIIEGEPSSDDGHGRDADRVKAVRPAGDAAEGSTPLSPTNPRDCEHGRQLGKCADCDLIAAEAEVERLRGLLRWLKVYATPEGQRRINAALDAKGGE